MLQQYASLCALIKERKESVELVMELKIALREGARLCDKATLTAALAQVAKMGATNAQVHRFTMVKGEGEKEE